MHARQGMGMLRARVREPMSTNARPGGDGAPLCECVWHSPGGGVAGQEQGRSVKADQDGDGGDRVRGAGVVLWASCCGPGGLGRSCVGLCDCLGALAVCLCAGERGRLSAAVRHARGRLQCVPVCAPVAMCSRERPRDESPAPGVRLRGARPRPLDVPAPLECDANVFQPAACERERTRYSCSARVRVCALLSEDTRERARACDISIKRHPI